MIIHVRGPREPKVTRENVPVSRELLEVLHTFAPDRESSTHGTFAPGNESSGNESSMIRIFWNVYHQCISGSKCYTSALCCLF